MIALIPLTPRFFLEQPWVERLGWTLLHFLWQGVLMAKLFAAVRAFGGEALSPARPLQDGVRIARGDGVGAHRDVLVDRNGQRVPAGGCIGMVGSSILPPRIRLPRTVRPASGA